MVNPLKIDVRLFSILENIPSCYGAFILIFNLQKVAVKEEKVEEEVKKAKVTSVKKKAEELPEIPDYERPELEKYEKISPTPTVREKPEPEKVSFLFPVHFLKLSIKTYVE